VFAVAPRIDGITSPTVIDGATTKERFDREVCQQLVRTRGGVVIIESAGATLSYLPIRYGWICQTGRCASLFGVCFTTPRERQQK
jgi:hypothetical protein